MKYLKLTERFFVYVAKPIRMNPWFFVFMYALGVLCTLCTLPRGQGTGLYGNLFLELFLDLYLLSALLTFVPRKVRAWVKMLFYVVFYVTALADVYCFVNYDSTLTPSMLMLVGETDSREVGDFLSSSLSVDVLFSRVGWIVLLILIHVAVAGLGRKLSLSGMIPARFRRWHPSLVAGIVCLGLLVVSVLTSAQNKMAIHKLMTGSTIGEVEHTLTEKNHAVLYEPVYRLVFSIYANSLAARQVDQLVAAADKVTVDSCTFRSPNIVLIIGESYGRHHSQQYGYFMKTTPRQVARENSGLLVKFTDVISCWNLTSFVFKNVFSLHVVGEKGEWCDYPLFPEVFRKAGYHVTFLTNQFLPQAKEAVYDFSGGFFLNNPVLSRAQFDTRNTELHTLDEGLLEDFDTMKKEGTIPVIAYPRRRHSGSNPIGTKATDAGKTAPRGSLTIFHLIGQHVNYKTRYPRKQEHFWAGDYEERRPELTDRERKVLSQYDNAVLYNDSIVDQVIRRYEKEDAIIIYMPDHGEECYEDDRGFICRNHSAAIDWPLAHYEFEIPFWIYCSHRYAVRHPEIFKQIVEARKRRFMTDALPHLLLYLAGISSKDYHAEYNVLSPDYNEMRPRILKGTTDYDVLREKHLKEMENGK